MWAGIGDALSKEYEVRPSGVCALITLPRFAAVSEYGKPMSENRSPFSVRSTDTFPASAEP